MKYLPRWSASVWALLVLLTGSAVVCLSPAWSADQKPLVINPTTGKQEQLQPGNRLQVPDASGDMVVLAPGVQTANRVSTFPVMTGDSLFALSNGSLVTTRLPFATTNGILIDSADMTFSSGVFTLGDVTGTNLIVASTDTTAAISTNGCIRGLSYRFSTGTLFAESSENYHILKSQAGSSCIYMGGAGDPTNYYDNTTHIFRSIGGAEFGYINSTEISGVRLLSTSTADSTSKDTGAIVTEGGIGSEKAVTTGTNFIAGVAGGGLLVKEGTNAKMGAATLVAGTVTVNTTAVTANSRIYLTSQADGGTVGFQRISARTPGTDFTITSSSVLDTSTVAWMIVEPAP